MKKSTLTVFLTFAVAFLTVPLTANGAIHYKYKVADSKGKKTVDYWLSSKGLQMNMKQGNLTRHVLYNVSEDAMYSYKSPVQTSKDKKPVAQKVPREKIKKMMKRVRKKMEQMKQRLKNLPPKRRKRMKRMMGMKMKDPEKVRKKVKPEFVKTGEGKWNGKPADKGKVMVGDKKRSELVMVREQLVPASSGQLAGLKGLKTLFEDLMTFARSMPNAGGMSRQFTRGMGGQVFMGPKMLRVVEASSPQGNMKLADWGKASAPRSNFKPPSKYKISTMGQRSKGRKPSGRRGY
ncbi:MAG: hypothetical protein ABEJ65_07235 [bacterium]